MKRIRERKEKFISSFFNRKYLRELTACVLATSVAIASIVTASALTAFGKNENDVINEFVSQYGWDKTKMTAYSWTGIDGKTHNRSSQFEKSFYEDVYKTNEELAITLGLITKVPETGGNASSMVALAIAEWEAGICETPMGSNRVKYNDWYYGQSVSGEAYPWCCAFISWLADQCGLINLGIFTKTAGCSVMRSHFINQGYEYWGIRQSTPYGGTETPVPGDIIIWGETAHIGIIVAVNDDSIETIEGNAGDRVAHNTYTSSDLTGLFGASEVFRVQYPDDEYAIFNFLSKTMGLPPAGAIGVVANIYHESNFNAQIVGDGGTSYGICQWHDTGTNYGRWTNLKNFCSANGYNWETLDGQLYFLQHELETDYPYLLNKLRTVSNSAQGAYEAAFAWCHDFERCAGYEYDASNYRGITARSTYWPKYEEMGLT